MSGKNKKGAAGVISHSAIAEYSAIIFLAAHFVNP
jgi:hypothetical protein